MRKIKYFCLCAFSILVTMPVWTQIIIDTVYFDDQWEKTERDKAYYYRIISTGKESDILFYVEDHYMTGEVQMTGFYKSISPDNKHGEFIYYFRNGQKNQICTFNENELNGTFRSWYQNGQLSAKTRYIDGKPDGEYEEWYSNGMPRMIVDYSKGLRDGRFFTFYDNGKPARYDFYVDDRLTQKQCFTSDGRKTEYFPYMEDATFPGGINSFKKYIYESIRFPAAARERNMRGHVMVEFEILESGRIGEVKIIDSDNTIFNDEAIRIIRNSPPWNPGRIDGINASMRYRIPIIFQI